MERQPGEIFEFEGKKIITEGAADCVVCYFYLNNNCNSKSFEATGRCSSFNRKDKSNVIFHEVKEKED